MRFVKSHSSEMIFYKNKEILQCILIQLNSLIYKEQHFLKKDLNIRVTKIKELISLLYFRPIKMYRHKNLNLALNIVDILMNLKIHQQHQVLLFHLLEAKILHNQIRALVSSLLSRVQSKNQQ